MSRLSIRREHRLGLARARELAADWAVHAARAYGLQCTIERGAVQDRVRFQRSGVEGVLTVGATAVAIDAKLSALLGPLRRTIGGQIEAGLDRLLAAEAADADGASPPAGAPEA
jgi:putative polyhydroxyalkanoate system protein